MERLTLDDMIKALKCVASQDTIGDCYAGHENFMHRNDEHKRIVCGTGEDLRDYISGKEAVGCPYYQNTYGCCFENGELSWLKDVAELLEELKSYKDLEEHGLFVRLPCKVGDTVWVVTSPINVFGYDEYDGDAEYEVYESFLSSVSYYASGEQFRIYAKVTNSFIAAYFRECDFGESIFLTREDAEKKLEELENE
jgi:hypothetical protein|nr:MAG TPA: hypothetical protein [Siphoviridae sp. ctnoo6]